VPRLPKRPLGKTPGHGRTPQTVTRNEPEPRPGPRKIAVIDVGSNTSRLIILAHTPGVSFRLIDQVREQVRLSEGMGAENLLRPEPMERTIRLLRVFRGLCEANGIDTIVAVGTSAVRDARNQTELLKRIREEVGLTLRVLTGEEEAHYGFLGAVNSLAIGNSLVVDIGGGSMELVRVEDRRPVKTVMLPAGAVRLTEAFLREDPPKAAEIRTLSRYIEYLLRDCPGLKDDRARVSSEWAEPSGRWPKSTSICRTTPWTASTATSSVAAGSSRSCSGWPSCPCENVGSFPD
jgi:exopolyphosphatase/pppGpp-phosphohydrolase